MERCKLRLLNTCKNKMVSTERACVRPSVRPTYKIRSEKPPIATEVEATNKINVNRFKRQRSDKSWFLKLFELCGVCGVFVWIFYIIKCGKQFLGLFRFSNEITTNLVSYWVSTKWLRNSVQDGVEKIERKHGEAEKGATNQPDASSHIICFAHMRIGPEINIDVILMSKFNPSSM